jgi:hypothetical protein
MDWIRRAWLYDYPVGACIITVFGSGLLGIALWLGAKALSD